MSDDEKRKLYKKIVDQTDPWLILERMRDLGFWPESEPVPEEPPEAREERAQLQDELARLRNKGSRVGDPQAALAKERVRRWQESKKRRALKRAQLEEERIKRREEWQAKKRVSLVHAGPGVSGGLEDQESDAARLNRYRLPLLHTAQDLAAAIKIELSTLRWLTYHRRSVTLVHYHRYVIPKRSGGERHISAPKPKLAAAQRWVYDNILCRVSVSALAHGFVRQRSIVSNAAPHATRRVVVNLDLENFFPSIDFRRVKGLFRSLGYGEAVATTLALLCTEPPRVEAELDGRVFQVALGDRVLPQGASTSPAITNLICRRLDGRLDGLSRKLGFAYTRYADDLTFSGDDPERLGTLLWAVRRIVAAEGFRENRAKTRVMRRGRRQEVTGLVVNDRVGIPRRERRRLRAILHNAARNGLEAENRSGHPHFAEQLRGHVAYVAMVHPERAKPLWEALDRALPQEKKEASWWQRWTGKSSEQDS
jgi:RNA-directed DNA polymerase